MKNDYLTRLRELLDRYQMEESEKQDIINDYDDMYENWLDYGLSDQEVEDKLGRPRSIIGSLVEGYKRVPRKPEKGSKFIAITPFISTVVFFILGFGFDGWIYAWMSFLLIPMSAIVINMRKDEHLLTALSPFIVSVAYFILGFYYNLWHPGWLVFLLIPVLGIFNSRKDMRFFELLTALSPFAAVIAYVYLGSLGYWVEGWVVFLIIPAIGLLNEKNKLHMIISELLLIGGVIGYLALGFQFTDFWGWAALAFVPFVLFQMAIGNIQLWSGDVPNGYKYVIVLSIVVYFILSFLTADWAFTWVVFFAIPVYAINREVEGSEKWIALMPFASTLIFMALGYYFDLWAWSWLAFLLIPVTAILIEVDS